MATNFPTSLDALTNPSANDYEDTVPHATQHANANDAIEALQAKVGVNNSAVTSSLDYLVRSTSSVDPGHYHIGIAPAYVVAASDTPAAIKKKADYICDGVDDEVQINAAISAAGSGKVYLCAGNYSISTAIQLRDNVVLQGAGKNATILRLKNGAASNTNVMETYSSATSWCFFVTLRDFCIDGNKANNSSGGHGIYAFLAHTWLFDNLFIKDCKKCGIDVVGNSSNIALNNWVAHCRVQDTYLENLVFGAYAPNNHVMNSIFGSTDTIAAVSLQNDEITFIGCHISGASTNGIQVAGSNNIIQGNYVEASGEDGIRLQNGVHGNRVIGNVIFNSGFTGGGGTYSGVKVEGQKNIVLGNRMFDRQGTKTQDYGVYVDSTATDNIIALNSMLTSDHTTGDIFIHGSASNNLILTQNNTDLSMQTGTNIQVNKADPKRAFYVPAASMWPSTTNGCAPITQVESSTNKVNIQVLDFDGSGSSKEYAEFALQSPTYWDASTVTAQFIWFATAGSGTVNWEIQGLARGDDDAIDTAYGTLQEVTDTVIATGDVHISDETAAITIAGTPVAGEWLQFRVARDPANDTDTSDARLLGVRIRFGIKQYDDQ